MTRTVQFVVAVRRGVLLPAARLALADLEVRDLDDGYAEHGADAALLTPRGAHLFYVRRPAPAVGDPRYPAVARARGFWTWRRRVEALTSAGTALVDDLRAVVERGESLWPDGLQDVYSKKAADWLRRR